jgi:hypothetical protein
VGFSITNNNLKVLSPLFSRRDLNNLAREPFVHSDWSLSDLYKPPILQNLWGHVFSTWHMSELNADIADDRRGSVPVKE